MGIGYWLTERVVYDPDSGQLLTHNTWVRDHNMTGDVYIVMHEHSVMCLPTASMYLHARGMTNIRQRRQLPSHYFPEWGIAPYAVLSI